LHPAHISKPSFCENALSFRHRYSLAEVNVRSLSLVSGDETHGAKYEGNEGIPIPENEVDRATFQGRSNPRKWPKLPRSAHLMKIRTYLPISSIDSSRFALQARRGGQDGKHQNVCSLVCRALDCFADESISRNSWRKGFIPRSRNSLGRASISPGPLQRRALQASFDILRSWQHFQPTRVPP
jgi:hypothetical protein